MARNPRRDNLGRLRSGGQSRLLDVFAGCGGLSLGFQIAGFDVQGGVEIDPVAGRSYAVNLHRQDSRPSREIHPAPRDITVIEPERLIGQLKPNAKVDAVVDGIVGGPPCQALARVGRAKLREVAHPRAFRQDSRGNLYLRYLHSVRKCQATWRGICRKWS